jgi:chromosome segregation ATPase
MQTALRDFAGVGERLEQLANEQHAGLLSLRQGQDDLWTAVRALQAADGEQNDSIARVSSTTEELSNHLVIHVDGVASRFAAMEERLTALDQFAQDIQPQLDTIAARLDGQTETLLHLEQRQVQRVATLNQVLDSLARLREPEPAEVGLPAVA